MQDGERDEGTTKPCVPITCPEPEPEPLEFSARVWSRDEIEAFYARGGRVF